MLPLAFGWRDLLFANYRVDPDALASQVPDALDVQVRDGDAWITVVPFVNVDARPLGAPRWLGFDLPEVNLRTYVTHDGEPGVYFFSLDAQGALGVLGARLTHFLPYYYARISVVRTQSAAGGEEAEFTAACRRRHPGAPDASLDATYRPTGEEFVAEAGSLAAFLVERRRLFALGPRGEVRYTDVEHEPYPLQGADADVEETLSDAAGLDVPGSEPLCYYSPGVDVTTTRSERWSDG